MIRLIKILYMVGRMTNLALGFALIPDEIGIKYVCELNRRVNQRYPSEFVLQPDGRLLPHASLFQGQFPESSLNEVYEAVRRIYEDEKSKWNVGTRGITVWATRIFFLDIDSTYLRKLHEDLFYTVNPLRDQGAGSADPQAFVGMTGDEIESFGEYGYPFALKAFRPHFTLGRSDNLDGEERAFAERLEREMPPPNTITFDKFVVFEVGKYGVLNSIIRGFPLG